MAFDGCAIVVVVTTRSAGIHMHDATLAAHSFRNRR
jgi:hypothetical protein